MLEIIKKTPQITFSSEKAFKFLPPQSLFHIRWWKNLSSNEHDILVKTNLIMVLTVPKGSEWGDIGDSVQLFLVS